MSEKKVNSFPRLFPQSRLNSTVICYKSIQSMVKISIQMSMFLNLQYLLVLPNKAFKFNASIIHTREGTHQISYLKLSIVGVTWMRYLSNVYPQKIYLLSQKFLDKRGKNKNSINPPEQRNSTQMQREIACFMFE